MESTDDSVVLGRLRRALLALLFIGLVGTASELVLLGHIEGVTQRIPLALLGVSVAVVVWHAANASRASVRVLQSVMRLSVVAGVLGVGLHYRGNLEFEREMYPTMSGVELIRKVSTGATPVLAPGAMSLLGIIGLLHAYRHPAVTRERGLQEGRS